ncbi:protein-L-isoaspartate O-methyltransferase family protein [Tardiphaga robiniae]|uniref:Protein-L-isoaspartate O-methyltransferase n=1 Tax=Tardiphaga robiniae TaxID=943830 RepID=A0A161R4I8_9BRAD|nr:protein-L-isoaspartate O-methyltransferase [Tardiphaga robiniae]KZD23951.1 protein-L-isoaspartate O-methyltransferase [Tardiphaga robiniae]
MSDFSTARQKMVDGQVRPSDVTDLRIIDAMLAVPREEFVPASQRAMAYLDLDLEVAPNRFLIKPVVLARMLQASDVKATDKVLVVGCPTGYAAAVIAQFAGQVTSAAGMPADGDVASGPYDLIVLAGATEVVPTGLYKQLAPDGQLVGVFALTKPARAVIVTHSHEDFGSRPLFDATAPVLPGMEKLPSFVF